MLSDLHSTHITDEITDLLEANKRRRVYPPSHSSNYTSGLDVGINGPLKKQRKTDITLWEAYLRKQSRSLRIEDFPHVVAGAISKAEEKEKLRCVQEETKSAHQEKKNTLKLMKASKELYITEQKKLKKLTQKNAKLVEKVQALKAQNRRLKGNAKQKVIAKKQNKNCLSTCKVKNPSEWVLCGGKSCPAGKNWYHIECSGTCMDAVKVLTADWFCDACLDGSTIESEETGEAEDSVDIAEGDSSEQDGYRSDVDGDSNAPEVDGAKDADSEDENEENLNESDEDSNCNCGLSSTDTKP